MRVGYARVSTLDQNVETQSRALRAAGCGMIYSESISGAKASRPEWDRALVSLEAGDQLVITRLDRAGRSLRHLLEVADLLDARGASLVVLEQAIDTSTSAGRALFQMLGVFAEFERSLISERTREALRGRPRGRNGGRPKALSPRGQARAQTLYDSGSMTLAEVAAAAGVSRATLCRHLDLHRNAAQSVSDGR